MKVSQNEKTNGRLPRARIVVQKPSPVAPNGLLEVDPFLGGFKYTVFKASHGVAANMLERTDLQVCRAFFCVSSHSFDGC